LEDIENESLSEMEEEEINKYILSSEETRIKQLIWNNLNKEWIEE